MKLWRLSLLFFLLLFFGQSHSVEQLMAEQQNSHHTVIEPKYNVRIERNVRIPARDGVELSVDLIRPDAEGRFPIIVEYHPYRKDDVSRGGLDVHRYFAERGFIGVRLDARGTGTSDGVNTDEYRPVEQSDGYDVIEWLAKQPYSNGNVGMWGTSYGGFTSIQVAMQQPPHLKAICPLYATDDRYTDDCHYTRGGNMRMYYDVGTYGGAMVAMNALPPLPELAGENWADAWKSRLENNEPYLLQWMKHQVDGEYWRGASLRPDYDKVQCAVYQIAGWHDGYVNAQLRMFANMPNVPRKILIGPWVHTRPNGSVPGPRIDYINEMCRFFAHFLRDEETGIMDEPAVTVYMQNYATPLRTLDEIPGGWRGEASFPAEGTNTLTFYLQEGGVLVPANRQKKATFDEQRHLPTVGTASSYWSAGGLSYYLAADQREDDARSLTYTTAPFEKETLILGWPTVVIYGSSTSEVATFVAKLCDVAPDGHSHLIVDGSINGTRRNSLTDPEPMTPGEIYELDIPIMPTGYVIPSGHRLRLSIATSDFPNLWPTPYAGSNRIYMGGDRASRVTLPVVPATEAYDPGFLPPPQLTSPVKSFGEIPSQQIVRDLITGEVAVTNFRSGTTVIEDHLGQLKSTSSFRCSASEIDPAQASIIGTHAYELTREDGIFKIVGESSIRATKSAFHIVINLSVTRNGEPFFQKKWMKTEPRRLL